MGEKSRYPLPPMLKGGIILRNGAKTGSVSWYRSPSVLDKNELLKGLTGKKLIRIRIIIKK